MLFVRVVSKATCAAEATSPSQVPHDGTSFRDSRLVPVPVLTSAARAQRDAREQSDRFDEQRARRLRSAGLLWLAVLVLISYLLVLAPVLLGAAEPQAPGWKAGTATAVITPKEPMWMAGYGGRDHESEGTHHDIWIKAVALEDAGGHRAVVVSSDTLGIPQSIYDNTCAALKEKLGLDRSQIRLNASHTHCGPVLRGGLYDIYPLDDAQIAKIDAYSTWLEGELVRIVTEAFDNLQPARVLAGQGTATFAVNRRNNPEPEVPKRREQNALEGPVDHAVPVLAIRSAKDDSLVAVVFGYACHNTTLSFYRWCGDYAGYAQMALEEKHPGAAALFYMGCGADQNPLPRRTVELCEQYGRRLAAAVDEVLAGEMRPLQPVLKTAYQRVTLDLGAEPTRDELEASAKSKSYIGRWANRLLGELDAGKTLARTYPFPLQVWRLGNDQLWIAMGGEVTVDYALYFKQQYGPSTWVNGYSNDVMAYIPSLRVLEEDVPPRASTRWGYEGNTSMMVYGLPAYRWADSIERRITEAAAVLVEQTK